MAIQILLGSDSLNQGYQKINQNFSSFTDISGTLYANLNVLADVSIENPVDNEILVYNSLEQKWKNSPIPTPSLDELDGVEIVNIQPYQTIIYNPVNSKYVNTTLQLNSLSNVFLQNVQDNQIMQYESSSGKWENRTMPDFEQMIEDVKILNIMGVI